MRPAKSSSKPVCVNIFLPFPSYLFPYVLHQLHLYFPNQHLYFFLNCRYPFTSNQVAPPLDWEQYVSEIAADIMKEQSPKRFIMFQLLWLYCSSRMLMILFCLLLFFYCSTYLLCEICEYHGFTTSLDLTSNFKFNISGYLLCARSSTNYL